MFDRLPPRHALLLHPVSEFDHQDAVFRDQPDQRHQADLGIDVDGCGAHDAAEVERQQGAEHRGRQCDQNDEGITEALELRRENQENDDQREDEGDDQRRSFLLILSAIALEIIGVAGRKDLGRLRFQKIQAFAERAAGKGHTLERRRTQLLEIV